MMKEYFGQQEEVERCFAPGLLGALKLAWAAVL
jgi:hypothetical protein